MDPSPEPMPPRRTFLGPALWASLGLFVLRLFVLGAMELLSHGADFELVRLRLAAGAPRLAGAALLTGIPTAAFLAFLVHRPGHGVLRGVTFLTGSVVVAGLFQLYLTGHLGEDVSRVVGTDTARGQQAFLLLAGGSLVAATALLLWIRRKRRPSAPLALALPLVLLFLPVVLARSLWTAVDQRMLVSQTEAELFLADWAWSDGREGSPTARVICPSTNHLLDGAGMPALSLPPPARARLVLASDGPAFLVARAGIDGSVWAEHGRELTGASIRFRVRLAGASVFEATLPIQEANVWVEVGDGGVVVRDGQELELETTLLDADGSERAAPAPLKAGFGGLKLERRFLRERTRASAQAPNVVFVLIDTLRADRTSVHGYERPTTPTLEALAARGTAFDVAYSTASWTWPATASVLTGMLPQEHGVLDATTAFLSETLDTLPEALQRAGVTTAGWSANPLIVPEKNFDQGFELFDAGRDGSMRRTETFFPGVLSWLDAAADYRFFLYLHIVDPHSPLSPHPEGRARFAADVPAGFNNRALTDYSWELLANKGHGPDGTPRTEDVVSLEEQRHLSDLYDACVWSADRWVGLVVERLEALGVLENTIVVVTSDHGEELFDHGLAAHAHTLYPELVNVPLVLAGPGVPVGERRRVPVSNRQLAPTLARLAGAELEGLSDARDLFEPTGGDVLFSTRQGWWNGRMRQPLYGMRRGPEVLHLAPEGGPWGQAQPRAGGDWRLFDAEADPGEHQDLARERPAQARLLRRDLEALLAALAGRRGSRAVEVDEGTLQMLKGIGYMGEDH